MYQEQVYPKFLNSGTTKHERKEQYMEGVEVREVKSCEEKKISGEIARETNLLLLFQCIWKQFSLVFDLFFFSACF